MTFSYTPADSPAIWMQFVPARENTARPAEEDNLTTEGMVHADMPGKTISVAAEEKQAQKEVSTTADGISENGDSEKTAGPHISSVDDPSQLAECEYQRDSIPVGKEQTERLSDDYFDSLNLMTTTGRGRDAVVVEMRMSADQSGSPVDCIAWKHHMYNQPKELCLVADGSKSDRLRCPMMDRLFCPQVAADKAHTAHIVCHENRLKPPMDAPVSRPGCWHEIDEDTVVSRFARHVTHDEERNGSWHPYPSIFRPSIDSGRGHLRHARSSAIDCFSARGPLIRN